jgi:D-alanyl-D-alanine carboxypeptidase
VLPYAEQLQAIVDGALESNEAVGFSLAVMVPGHETWVGAVGDSEPGVPVTPRMAFSSGSISKNFIAALVLQLTEEGKLSLDDQLLEWLPDYPNVDGTITVRQLLNHTSGIFSINRHPDFWTTVFADAQRQWTDAELFSMFLMEPYSPKGTEWHYSNTGYMLLGQIIETVTGSSVSAELRERFFLPLELDTAFYLSEETAPGDVAEGWFDISRYAPGVDTTEGVLERYSAFPWTTTMPEAGGVFASPEDLALWARALFHDRSVLSADSLAGMLEFLPLDPTTEEAQLATGYGLGAITFREDLFGGTTVIGHSGGGPFYAAASLYLPDYGVTIGAAQSADTNDSFGEALVRTVGVITGHSAPAS